jgi:hypothetical protein
MEEVSIKLQNSKVIVVQHAISGMEEMSLPNLEIDSQKSLMQLNF